MFVIHSVGLWSNITIRFTFYVSFTLANDKANYSFRYCICSVLPLKVFTTLKHKVFNIINNSWCDIVVFSHELHWYQYCLRFIALSCLCYRLFLKNVQTIYAVADPWFSFTVGAGGGALFVNGGRGSVDGWCLGYLFLGFGGHNLMKN